jgi:hypothetical protein
MSKVLLPRITEDTILELSRNGCGPDANAARHIRVFLTEQPAMAHYIMHVEETVGVDEGVLVATAVTLYECLKAQLEKGE